MIPITAALISPHMSPVGLFPDLPACLAAAAVSVCWSCWCWRKTRRRKQRWIKPSPSCAVYIQMLLQMFVLMQRWPGFYFYTALWIRSYLYLFSCAPHTHCTSASDFYLLIMCSINYWSIVLQPVSDLHTLSLIISCFLSELVFIFSCDVSTIAWGMAGIYTADNHMLYKAQTATDENNNDWIHRLS